MQRSLGAILLILLTTLAAVPASAQGTSDDASYRTATRRAEERLKRPWYSRWLGAEEPTDAIPPATVEALANEARRLAEMPLTQDGKHLVRSIEIAGDRAFFFSCQSRRFPGLSLASSLRFDVIGKYWSPEELQELCRTYTEEEFIAQKYLLAYMRYEGQPIEEGRLILTVRTGKFGKVRFLTYDRQSAELADAGEAAEAAEGEGLEIPTETRPPANPDGPFLFGGKYFTRQQLRERLHFQEFDPFAYRSFYQDVYALNRSQDLNLDTNMRVVTDADTGEKLVDLDFVVEEAPPIHGRLTLDNTASQDNGDWLSSLTFQHLNLTRNFDVLSLDFSSSLDGTLLTAGASYSYPFAWRDSSLWAFGGVSSLDVNEIAPGVDSEGGGWFGGLQYEFSIYGDADHNLALDAGFTIRYTTSTTNVGGVLLESALTSSPLNLGLSYAGLRPDNWNGRNFARVAVTYHQGDLLTGDADQEFDTFKAGSEADYKVVRYQVARSQQLFDPVRDFGSYTLFAKVDGQWTDDSLISAEQKSIGGAGTVRGYANNTFTSDEGISGTLELRTPFYDRRVFEPEEAPAADVPRMPEDLVRPVESVQFLIFADYGWVRSRDVPTPTVRDAELWSAGLGFRVGLWDHLQLALDYGKRFNDHAEIIEDPAEDGRFHVALDLYF